ALTAPGRPLAPTVVAPAPASAAVVLGVAAVAPAATGQVPGTALRLNLGAEPDTIDPARASFAGEIEVVMRVFSNLYKTDRQARLVPDQAAGLPDVSADGKTITVRLKAGLVWSDGKPLTAQDVVYGVKRQLNPTVASGYAFTLWALHGARAYSRANVKTTSEAELQRLRDAVGISAPDALTVVYQLSQSAPWFPSILATWCGLPAREDLITAGGAVEDNQDWTRDLARYVGNGPYRLTVHDPGARLVFATNPRYARGEPPIATVEYAMIKDATVALASYQAGQLDVIGPKPVGVSAAIKPAIDRDPVLSQEYRAVPGACVVYLGLNSTLPPFDNPKVRQAFAAAFDRETLATRVLRGLGAATGQLVPPGVPGHYADIPVQTFDPAKAKQLLAEAGFPGGKGLPPIKATYANVATSELIITTARAMFAQNLGVDVQLDPIEPRAFAALTKTQATTPQLFLLGWCQDYPDPQDWYSTVFQSSSTASHTGWHDATFDRLTRAADVETDPKQRGSLYRQAAAILDAAAPVIFLYDSVAAVLVKPEVKGYTLDPFEYFFGQHSLDTLKLA
ncbi:MAG: peptide ABC transporter substrate-binding protein, partial [Chloroflexota bacterium]